MDKQCVHTFFDMTKNDCKYVHVHYIVSVHVYAAYAITAGGVSMLDSDFTFSLWPSTQRLDFKIMSVDCQSHSYVHQSKFYKN